MADSSRPKLGSHLEWHGSKIRVKVRVPPTVQRSAKLSAWLKVTLPTDSARTAETLKWPVIAKLKQQIEDARNGVVSGTHADPLLAEGLLWRDAIADDPSAGGPSDFTVVHHLYDRVDEVVSAQGEAKGDFLAGIALGMAPPLDSLIDPWIAEKGYRGRTAVAHRHSLRVFGAWCVAEKVAVTVEAVTRKVAGRFVTKTFIEPGIHPATANKALSALSSYWGWLLKRGHRDEAVNPWQGQFIKAGSRPKGEDGQGMKRPFTDTEARTLLDGITRQPLADMCLLAALSGCRITELAELKVRHVTLATDDKPCISAFRIVQGKTDSAARHVPIHSDECGEVIAELCASQKPISQLHRLACRVPHRLEIATPYALPCPSRCKPTRQHDAGDDAGMQHQSRFRKLLSAD